MLDADTGAVLARSRGKRPRGISSTSGIEVVAAVSGLPKCPRRVPMRVRQLGADLRRRHRVVDTVTHKVVRVYMPVRIPSSSP